MSRTALPTIEAPLNFMVPSNEKPKIVMSVKHDQPNLRTGEFRLTWVSIADARALPEPPSLDQRLQASAARFPAR